ncbi:MAG: TonB-dependent receptor [Gemmatimonadota bacterium]|nr:TonB-dependent receptor [Gemmatimonadota bacterium]
MDARRFAGTGLLVALGSLVFLPPALSAQQATITGEVVESGTRTPIAGAQVSVVGTGIGGLTNNSGRYLLTGVAPGEVTVQVQSIGYSSQERVLTVAADETAEVNFQLRTEALGLDELVVTGTAGGQQRRAIGNVVGNIDGSVAEVAPIDNISNLLRGRESGVVVNQGNGSPGTASVVRIRGQSSMSGDNQPLLYVDGVRVNNRMSTPQGGSSAGAVSRIDDFSPDEIESVEVIKGPAAATLYGTEASNGVIHIITKRGSFDQPAEWTLSTRQGANWLHDPAGKVPINWGINPSTGEPEGLNLVEREKERGNDIFSYGRIQDYSLSVSGGSETMRYFVSGSGQSEDGATPDSWQKRYNARANVSAQPAEVISIEASTGFSLNEVRVPGRGAGQSALRSLFLGSPEHLDTPRRGFWIAPPEAFYERSQFVQDATRMTTSLTFRYDPTDWFNHRLTFGLDLTDQKNTAFTPHLSPSAAQFWSEQVARGSRNVRQESVQQSSFDYAASVSRDLSERVSSTTSAGLQVNTKRVELTQAIGEGFPAPGVESVGGAATTFGSDDVVENNTVGLYVQEQLGWENRIFLTAAVRADDNSAFGEEFSLVYYPKVSGSWVISEEDFWGLDFVSSLRLRAAYGESGQQPDVFDAIRSFSPRAQPDGSPAVFPDAPGNPDLGPEQSREIEAGFDATMFGDRVSLDLTFYDQVTRDAIVSRNVAPSDGFFEDQFVNIGRLSNRGVEVSLDARTLDLPTFDWDLGVNVGTNRNRIEDLGLESFLELGWTTRHQEGYPAASLFAPRVVSAEVTPAGDPVNILCDDGQGGSMDCGDAPWLYAGHPDPSVEGSVSSTFTFGDRIQLGMLADFKLGQTNYSTQMWWRYAALGIAEELWHPETADPRILGAAELGRSGEFQLWTPASGYMRFREVSLSAPLPTNWAERIGARAARVSLAARNLGMIWTEYFPYPAQDPESRAPANQLGGNREPEDTDATPPLTSLALTFRITF